LHMTATQYFWLVDHNDWSRWFAISSPRLVNDLNDFHTWLTVRCVQISGTCNFSGAMRNTLHPPPPYNVPWLVKGATQLFNVQNECNKFTVEKESKKSNKLHMTATQYFWLVDHNDWSRWFAISSPPDIYSSTFSSIGGVAKKKS